MGVRELWEKKKSDFEKSTLKSKPKTKVMGIAFKSTGISNSLSLVDKAPGYKAKAAALHVFVAQATAYMKALKAEMDACEKKNDAAYVKALKDLANGLEDVSTSARNLVKDELNEMQNLVKSGKLKEFVKYCKGEFSTENVEFYFEIKKVKKVTDLRALLDDYILSNSAKELNIDKKTKQSCLLAVRGEFDLKKAVELLTTGVETNICDTVSRFRSTLKLPHVKSTL